jgi:hypothetical protein
MTGVSTDRRSGPRADDPEMRGRRAEPRACLVLPASTEALDGHRYVRLLDVSRSGARLEGFGLPAVGKDVLVKCGGIEMFGTIAWAAGSRCGVQFDEPIGGRDLVALRALAARSADSEMTAEEREAQADWQNGLAR